MQMVDGAGADIGFQIYDVRSFVAGEDKPIPSPGLIGDSLELFEVGLSLAFERIAQNVVDPARNKQKAIGIMESPPVAIRRRLLHNKPARILETESIPVIAV